MSLMLVLEIKKLITKYMSFINLINFTVLKILSCLELQLQFADKLVI